MTCFKMGEFWIYSNKLMNPIKKYLGIKSLVMEVIEEKEHCVMQLLIAYFVKSPVKIYKMALNVLDMCTIT